MLKISRLIVALMGQFCKQSVDGDGHLRCAEAPGMDWLNKRLELR